MVGSLCVVLSPAYKETGVFTARLKARRCHSTLFFCFHFAHENLVPWPYPGETEAGKYNLNWAAVCWALIMEERDDCFCRK